MWATKSHLLARRYQSIFGLIVGTVEVAAQLCAAISCCLSYGSEQRRREAVPVLAKNFKLIAGKMGIFHALKGV
ncbi:hypothetical protein [Hymenobacter psychrotolerans]|uniref:hypothetical protein n=1 Tax=Hymenobacter psychrotolerans TaxID=344998 RepID=UPI000933E145|nr:hypothetical protein [Hymenobacter psychrotolerans]